MWGRGYHLQVPVGGHESNSHALIFGSTTCILLPVRFPLRRRSSCIVW